MLDEQGRQAVAATEAMAIGWGIINRRPRATAPSRQVIGLGIRELDGLVPSAAPRMAGWPGGGRKSIESHDPGLSADRERLVEPVTRGDLESSLRWICKSLRRPAIELRAQGHRVSYQKVANILHEIKHSLQGSRKGWEVSSRPDRDARFAHINATATALLTAGEPAISVNTTKKELVGDCKNGGGCGDPWGSQRPSMSIAFPSRTRDG